MKPIKMTEKNWKKLHQYRLRLGVKRLDDVLSAMFRLIEKFKLGSEMQEEAKW